MALFEGEEIVDVTTPDGRTLKLPRSIVPASLMPQQPQIAQAPAGPAPFAPAPPQPQQEVATPVLTPPDVAPPVVEEGEPEVTPVVEMAPEVVTANPKRVAKARAAQAAVAASPQGQRAASEQAVQDATAAKKQAVEDAALVEGATQDVLAVTGEAYRQKIDRHVDDRARFWNDRVAQEEKKNGEITDIRKKIASTKIDRSADHPILAAIGIALAGLGSAMKGESTNPALEVFWKALDRKVAGQMADLDLMEKTYGMKKDELASFREGTGRQLEFRNAMIAGEADKAKRHLETIVAKGASEKTRANAKIMMADIDERAAAAHQSAVHWGLEYDQRDQAEKNQNRRFFAGLAQQDRHHADDMQLKREEMAFDVQKALAAERARGDEAAYKAKLEMVKDNEERGIRGVDGNFLLTKAGQARMAQATQLEEEAAKLEEAGKADPMSFSGKGGKDKVEAMRAQASQLRATAQINDIVRHRDKTQAGKFSDSFAAAQTVLTQIDNIKALSTRGRDFFFTDDGRAELQAAFNALAPTLKEAWQLGAWDKGSAGLVEKIIGGDPSAWATVVLKMESPDAFLKRLDTVARDLETGVQNQLSRQTGWTGKKEDIFGRKTLPNTNTPEGRDFAAMSQDKTPREREAGAAGGAFRRNVVDAPEDAARAVASAFTGNEFESSAQARTREAEASGSVRHLGLFNEKQGAAFDNRLKAYRAGDAKQGDLLVAQVVNNATARPELALATLKNLQQFEPKLYEKARAALPAGPVAEQIELEETNRIGVAQQKTSQLVIVGRTIGWSDPEMKAELARRATAGDKEAVRAVREIITTKQRDDMPKGPVFREGH